MTETQSLAERLLEQVLAGTAARNARLVAAKGSLPFSRVELVHLQILLYGDEDEEIKQAALSSLESISPNEAAELAADADATQELLHFLSGWISRWIEAGPVLGRRQDAAPATLRLLAESSDTTTLTALVGNQVALRGDPQLVRLLVDNPALERGSRQSLLDYLEELNKDAARRESAEAAESATEEPSAETTESPDEEPEDPSGLKLAADPFLASLGIDAEVEAMLPELGLDIGQLSERSELLGDDFDDADEGLIKKISNMNVGQKLRVALFGTKEERTILVRDSNRLVASAVVKNPKFTDSEADSVAKSRNVSDEVLRLIGRHRDFAKQYSIQHSLVLNPRTPMDVARGFIPFLNDRDLNMISKSRNVSDVVRRQAKKTYMVRTARRQGRRAGA